MGIVKNNKNIIAIYRGDKKITSVFKNNLKIFGESEPPQYNYKNVTLRTSSDGEKVKLYNNNYFDSIYIYDDDVTINPEETKEYTFTTRGDHKVGYAIKKGITSFYAAFKNIYQLVGIDDDFFSDNTELTDISEAFQNVRIENLKKELVSPLINLEKVSNTFSNNSYLSTTAFDLFADNEKIKDFSYTFNNCYNWRGQCPVDKNGEKLFVRSDGNNGYTIPTYTQGCFLGCGSSDMSIIPNSWGGDKVEPLICVYTQYSGNIEITRHIEYFKLVKFPDENGGQVLYDSTNGEQSGAFYADINYINTVEFHFKDDVTDLQECFSSNTNLISVKGKLPSRIARVASMFNGCSSLTEISEKMFANCYNIIDFQYTFYDCWSITSHSPIDNDGTSIYNRSNNKEGYDVPYWTSGCFYNCVSMQDYSSIPSNWT